MVSHTFSWQIIADGVRGTRGQTGFACASFLITPTEVAPPFAVFKGWDTAQFDPSGPHLAMSLPQKHNVSPKLKAHPSQNQGSVGSLHSSESRFYGDWLLGEGQVGCAFQRRKMAFVTTITVHPTIHSTVGLRHR